MDGVSGVTGGGMTGEIARLARSMNSATLDAEIATTLLKQVLEMQKAMAAQLMQSIGVGQTVDIAA